MALMTWSSKYSVGVKALDDQHAAFMGALNQLHAAMMKGQAQSVVGPLLNKLGGLARDHFAAEEALMTSTNYPGTAEHRAKHQDLLKLVEQYVARFRQGDSSLCPLLKFMREWLTDHMDKVDHLYEQWLHDHDVQ